jgi:hypothetical protein
MTVEGAGVVGSWVFLRSKNFDDEMAYHRNAEQKVAPDFPSLVEPALSLIGPPYFVKGKDWDLDGSCPSLSRRTNQPVTDAASVCAVAVAVAVAEKLAVDELAC